MNAYIRELIGKLERTEIWDKEKKRESYDEGIQLLLSRFTEHL